MERRIKELLGPILTRNLALALAPALALALSLNLTRSSQAEAKKKAQEAELENPSQADGGTMARALSGQGTMHAMKPGLTRQDSMLSMKPGLTRQDSMLVMKTLTETQDGIFPFIEEALVEHAKRYEVARHIVRRTYSAWERLPLGAIVSHPDRGRGTIVEVLPDLRRVVRFDKGGEVHRYSPQSLYKLVLHELGVESAESVTVAGELARKGADASGMPSKEPSWNALPMIRAGETAALQHLEHSETRMAAELNALRTLPSQALRQRGMSSISLGSTQARLLRLLGVRLAALSGSTLSQGAGPLGAQPLP